MSLKLCRVELIEPRGECDPFIVDVVLTPEKRVVHKFNTSGWWGTFRDSDLLPFILKGDGRLDFGSEFECDHRIGKSNLSDRKIEPNEYVTILIDGSDEYCLRIQRVIELAELLPTA